MPSVLIPRSRERHAPPRVFRQIFPRYVIPWSRVPFFLIYFFRPIEEKKSRIFSAPEISTLRYSRKTPYRKSTLVAELRLNS